MNCYILVGGASKRMGKPKLNVPFAGTTFLDRVVTAARPVFDEVVAVQRPAGPAINALRTIFEPDHDLQAPVFGLWRALEDAGARSFVLAIDYPLITAEVLRYLAGRASQSRRAMVVPRWNGKLQMLCAAYSPVILPRIAPRIAAGQLNLRGLTDDIDIIEENELRERFAGEPLLNVNTPEELVEAERMV
jgi:molybdopterin-guanine dinucleotide biosynthesis protein A